MSQQKSINRCTFLLFILIVSCFLFHDLLAQNNFPTTSETKVPRSIKPSYEWKLWYKQPAYYMEEALPLGNGRMGAMIFGGVHREHLDLSEETIWSHQPREKEISSLYRILKQKQRELLFHGKYKEAAELTIDDLKAQGFQEKWRKIIPGVVSSKHIYQPLGDLYIHFPVTLEREKNYRRELDLDRGVATVTYQLGETKVTREFFCSAVDQVLVIRLASDKPGKISFKLNMDRPTDVKDNVDPGVANKDIPKQHETQFSLLSKDYAIFSGQAEEEGIKFQAHVKILHEGGQLNAGSNSLGIDQADNVSIMVTMATNYMNQKPGESAKQQLDAAAHKSYHELLDAHIKDHQKLFRRVDIDLGANSPDREILPTDQRLINLQRGYKDPRNKSSDLDPQLFALYFQYGRYLMIATSRPGTLPPNLIFWNDGLRPPWYGRHTSNVNAQENYWPVEVVNLSECHEPLLDFVESFTEAAQKTADICFGARGLVLQGRGLSIYGPEFIYDAWQDGAGWLAEHFWEHYEFTQDIEFLKNRAYPWMKDVTLFYLDFLVKYPQKDWLLTGPGYSPEHAFLDPHDGELRSMSMGVTNSLAIIREVFANTAKVSQILDVDADLRDKIDETLPKLAPYQKGKYGQLQEWLENVDEMTPGHRHLSHLYPLYPGKQISKRTTPELAQLAETALRRRIDHGSGWVGWSRAWIINLAARLENADLAYQQLQLLLKNTTFPNLFDGHPRRGATISVPQIDGNFGGIAGIAEMLLQSHLGEIHLLPALPEQWPQGHVQGLRARGGFEIDLFWKEKNLDKVTIYSLKGEACKVRHGETIREFDTEPGTSYTLDANLN